MPACPIEPLRRAAEACLQAHGMLPRAAAIVVDHLLAADLRGRPSHGLATRLPAVVEQARQGVAGAPPELLRDDATTLLLDGHNTNGYLAGHDATELLVERALAHGHCLAALRRVRHTGMLGYYVERAARAGLVAMAFTHCTPLMAPAGGTRRLLGTNPLAFAFPAAPDPILVDLSTAAVSYGQLRVAEQHGLQLPLGVALAPDGTPTRDPADAIAGCVLPFGGAKGGALAVAVQLLAGAFLGAAPVPPPGQDYGLLLIACRKGLFATDDTYDAAVAEFAAAYLAVPPQPGQTVRLPGQRRSPPPATLELSPALQSLLAPYL